MGLEVAWLSMESDLYDELAQALTRALESLNYMWRFAEDYSLSLAESCRTNRK